MARPTRTTVLPLLAAFLGCGNPQPQVKHTAYATPFPAAGAPASAVEDASLDQGDEGANVGEGPTGDPTPETCSDLECADNQYCEDGDGQAACRDLLQAGLPCLEHYQCAAHLYCETSLDLPECRKAPGKGGECEYTGAICAEGFYCDLGDYPAKCKVPGKAGQHCYIDAACADGRYCDFQDLDPRCRKVTTAVCDPATGAPCDEGQFCYPDHDPPLCLPLGAEGQGCHEDWMCTDGMTCAFDSSDGARLCSPGG